MSSIKGIFIITVLLMAGCVKDEVERLSSDSLEYFPLTAGKYITYQVDSIVFDDEPGGILRDTSVFLLREEIAGFELVNNDTVFYFHRSRRDDENGSWLLKDVWTARRNSNEAVRTEENLTFRKMTFPLREGKRWSATSYINPLTTILIGTEYVQAFQEWQSEVTAFNISDQIGDFSFTQGNVMHISLTDTDDGGQKRYVMEKYVRNIGLVQRTDTILDSHCLLPPGDFTPCIGKPWIEHAGKGYILSQIMIDHN